MARETIVHTVLSNNLQVKFEVRPHQRTVNLGMFIDFGSQHEEFETSGTAHFIEHTIFNPTHLPKQTKLALEKLTDAGSSYEAFTSKEYTRCGISCLPELTNNAVEALSLLITEPQVNQNSIEHEKTVILHEHSMVFRSHKILRSLLENSMWGNQSLGLYTVGRKEIISSISRATIYDYLSNYYVPERTTLVALGPIDGANFLDAVSNYFETWKESSSEHKDSILNTEPSIASIPHRDKRVDLIISYVGVSFSSSDKITLELLADILGGDHRSRLFQRLREKEELVYYVHANSTSYFLGGYLAIKVNCDRESVKRVVEIVEEEVNNIQNYGVESSELDRAKATRITAILGILENSTQHIRAMGYRSIINQNFFVDVDIRHIRSVTIDSIRRVCNDILIQDNMSLVGYGPENRDLLDAL